MGLGCWLDATSVKSRLPALIHGVAVRRARPVSCCVDTAEAQPIPYCCGMAFDGSLSRKAATFRWPPNEPALVPAVPTADFESGRGISHYRRGKRGDGRRCPVLRAAATGRLRGSAIRYRLDVLHAYVPLGHGKCTDSPFARVRLVYMTAQHNGQIGSSPSSRIATSGARSLSAQFDAAQAVP